MKCPRCDSASFVERVSQPLRQSYVRRRRVCLKGHRFTTRQHEYMPELTHHSDLAKADRVRRNAAIVDMRLNEGAMIKDIASAFNLSVCSIENILRVSRP